MEENKFKVKDIVVYIDSDGPELEEGQLYTVSGLRGNFQGPGIELEGHTGFWYEYKFDRYSKPQVEYEIVKPFSIIDIYEKNPCSGEYSALLRQNSDRNIDARWNRFKSIQKSPVLMRNLDWLKTKGFIKEAKNINHRIWTDTSYCKDMNLKKPVNYVFPEKGDDLNCWNTKVELLDTDLKIPSNRKDKEFKYFDSIVKIGNGDKFFTFSKFLKTV